MEKKFNRRNFIGVASVAGAGMTLGLPKTSFASRGNLSKPAILGGAKAHADNFPLWPVTDQTEENALNGVLRSKNWCRLGSTKVDSFEEEYKKLTGAKHCLATSSGTNALYTLLN